MASPNRRFVPLALVALLSLGAMPSATLAQYGDSEEEITADADARLRGYSEDGVVLPGGSTFLTYLALGGLSVLAAGVMFKSSRRTHLD